MKEKVNEKAPPRQARRQRGTKPGQQRRIRTQQKDCAQQQAKRKSEGTRRRPHSTDDVYRKAKFKSVGTAARVQCKRETSRIRRAIAADRSANDIAKQVTMTRGRERKVIRTREGNLRVKVTKIFCQSQMTEREARIDDHPAVLEEPKDHAVTAAMKAFIMKVDTAQSTTQWYWRTPTRSRSNDSRRADLRNSRTRCCKLPSVDRGHPPRTINHVVA